MNSIIKVSFNSKGKQIVYSCDLNERYEEHDILKESSLKSGWDGYKYLLRGKKGAKKVAVRYLNSDKFKIIFDNIEWHPQFQKAK